MGRGPDSTEGDFIDWLIITNQSETFGVLGRTPLVPSSVAIYGYIYDVKNGRLVEVPEATRVGGPG